MIGRRSLGTCQRSSITFRGRPAQPSPLTSIAIFRCAWATPPTVKCLAYDGTVLEGFEFPETPVENKHEIATSLTAMHRTMLKETSARVVLGG